MSPNSVSSIVLPLLFLRNCFNAAKLISNLLFNSMLLPNCTTIARKKVTRWIAS